MLPYQAVDLEEHGLTVDQTRKAAWWIGADGRRRRGAGAIAQALRACGWPWSWLGVLLLIPPISWLAALGYLLVARWRRRLPGSTPACRRGWNLDEGVPLEDAPPPPCHARRPRGSSSRLGSPTPSSSS